MSITTPGRFSFSYVAWTLSDTADLIGSVSDALTFVLGIAAVVAYFRHRKNFSALAQWFRQRYLSDRVNRISETVAALKLLNWEEKDSRASVVASMGELFGQLHGLPTDNEAVRKALEEITLWNEKPRLRSESRKRTVTELALVAVEAVLISSDLNFTQQSNGR